MAEPLNLAQPCPVSDPGKARDSLMSRCPARHAKVSTSRYEGRHAKPGTPGAGLIGTAAKAVPVTLAASAAGSALVLSGTASAAVIPSGPVHNSGKDPAAVKTTANITWITQGRHASPRTHYTVAKGDTLSHISARFCGTAADYPNLAAASGIANPDVIQVGQRIRLDCHHSVPAPARHASAPAANDDSASAPSSSASPAPAPPQQASTAGMSAFESCVIQAESGGNPTAVNPSSGAGGLFQFLPSTWASLGYASAYPGGAQTAPAGVQEAAFAKLYAEAGTSPWAPYDGC
jgi:LysM repeat protein